MRTTQALRLLRQLSAGEQPTGPASTAVIWVLCSATKMPGAAADYMGCCVVLSVHVSVRRQAGPLLLALLLALCKPSLHPSLSCDVCWWHMCRELEAGSIY